MSVGYIHFPYRDTIKQEVFTTGGTWTVPDGIDYIIVHGSGGGGGGQGGKSHPSDSSGGHGGQGAIPVPVRMSVSAGESFTWVIGAGGSGGTGNFEAGNNGNTTTFTRNSNGQQIKFRGARGGGQGFGASNGWDLYLAFGDDHEYQPKRQEFLWEARGGNMTWSGPGAFIGDPISSDKGDDSQYSIGGQPGLNTPTGDPSQAIDPGGAGGGAGYGPGGDGGDGGDDAAGTLDPTSGTDGGISAGGGGGGANGGGVIQTTGGDGGNGIIIIEYSRNN